MYTIIPSDLIIKESICLSIVEVYSSFSNLMKIVILLKVKIVYKYNIFFGLNINYFYKNNKSLIKYMSK